MKISNFIKKVSWPQPCRFQSRKKNYRNLPRYSTPRPDRKRPSSVENYTPDQLTNNEVEIAKRRREPVAQPVSAHALISSLNIDSGDNQKDN